MINLLRRFIYGGIFPERLLLLWQNIKNFFAFKFARRKFYGYDKLHLACGNNFLTGWANVDLYGPSDVIRWDLRNPFPIKESTIKYVYTEHFIEHISRADAKKLLIDIFRILAVNGTLRLTTPSLEKVIEKYIAQDMAEWNDVRWYPSSPCDMMNGFFRNWDHVYVYDLQELTALLKECGFGEVKVCGWGLSNEAVLCGLEKRPFHGELIVEAKKLQ